MYYVQYAHARICSILKKMESEGVQFAGAEKVDATLLTEPSEMDLIRMLAAFPQEIVMAAEKYDPSRINRFVIDLASASDRFCGSCRIQGADPAVAAGTSGSHRREEYHLQRADHVQDQRRRRCKMGKNPQSNPWFCQLSKGELYAL